MYTMIQIHFLTNNEIVLDTMGYCGAFWYYHSDVSNPGIIDYPCTNGPITNHISNYVNISWFACNLPDINEYTWNDANQYCNDRFGTATIISETDNNNAYATVTAIENFFDLNFDDTLTFIRIHKINNKSSFNFADERDSYAQVLIIGTRHHLILIVKQELLLQMAMHVVILHLILVVIVDVHQHQVEVVVVQVIF